MCEVVVARGSQPVVRSGLTGLGHEPGSAAAGAPLAEQPADVAARGIGSGSDDEFVAHQFEQPAAVGGAGLHCSADDGIERGTDRGHGRSPRTWTTGGANGEGGGNAATPAATGAERTAVARPSRVADRGGTNWVPPPARGVVGETVANRRNA